ncbi:MAG: hypothetical protein A4S09_11910 [Proteobacteria bacterium SG_bin7]|nr:MAG: hypothetical protein A4S09_11910 [Proteobacteria bacterium SG_bin7]
MKLSKLLLPAALIGLAMTSMVGCGGGGGDVVVVDTYYSGWYDVYGARCGSLGPGCNYYANGLKIIDIEDPYFSSSYLLEFGVWDYFDTYGVPATYTGWAWLSPTNVLYDDFGNALNEEKSEGRNVVGDVAAKELKVVNAAAKDVSAKFGLSQSASQSVAKLLNTWAVIGKDRARTANDVADFTERLYGIDVATIKVALSQAQQGEMSGLESAASEIADRWDTTPSMVIDMQKRWFAPHLKSYGVNVK